MFSQIGGVAVPGIARIPTGPGTTGAPDAWRSAVGGYVNAFALRGDTVFLGGELTPSGSLAAVSATDGSQLKRVSAGPGGP